MSVLDRQTFTNPPHEYRPLQIIHGFGRNFFDPETLEGKEGIDRLLAKLAAMGIGGIVANVAFTDIIDEQALVEAEVRDGALRIADEAYRAVALPPMDAIGLGAARALNALARAGGTVVSVGPPPGRAECPPNAEALRREMAALFAQGGAGHLVPVPALPDFLRSRGASDFTLGTPNPDILYSHRRRDGHDIYYVINNSPNGTTITPTLRSPGPYDLYRPLTGVIEGLGRTLTLDIDGYDAVFIVAAGGGPARRP